MNLWMDTAQTHWTARHKQHIGQEACFFAGGSVSTKLGTGIAQTSIAGIMSLCGYISSTVPGMAAKLCRESVSRPARTGRQGVFRLCAVSASRIFTKSLSLRHCGCPLFCI